MRRAFLSAGLLTFALFPIHGQDIKLSISGGAKPRFAVADFAGAAGAQPYMEVVNQTVWDDLDAAGIFELAAKTLYPKATPHYPSDFPPGTSSGRPRLGDWAAPPVSAGYLCFGHAAITNGVFALYGWLYDLRGATPAAAEAMARRYAAAPGEEGARRTAHQFAADIISMFGGQPLFGTHIYFTSDRTGHKEIWAMDPDGRNQRQVTRINFLAQFPAISPDGSKLAFTAWPGLGQSPRIFIYSTEPVRDLRFRGPQASVVAEPSFTPDGRQIVYMATSENHAHRIFFADLAGAGAHELTLTDFDDAEPRVNPKTGADMVFSSGRSGKEQIYRSNMDGLDVERLTNGTGEASNPCWNPNGQSIAFAWTEGYEPGHFNVFTMDIAARTYVQLTHNEGKNENPNWSPGGTHIVFGSNRGGSYQIWSMRADGTDVRQLTTVGNNSNPVWGK